MSVWGFYHFEKIKSLENNPSWYKEGTKIKFDLYFNIYAIFDGVGYMKYYHDIIIIS